MLDSTFEISLLFVLARNTYPESRVLAYLSCLSALSYIHSALGIFHKPYCRVSLHHDRCVLHKACTGCFLVCHLHAQLVLVSWVEHLTSGDCRREPDRWCIPGGKQLQRDTNICCLYWPLNYKQVVFKLC